MCFFLNLGLDSWTLYTCFGIFPFFSTNIDFRTLFRPFKMRSSSQIKRMMTFEKNWLVFPRKEEVRYLKSHSVQIFWMVYDFTPDVRIVIYCRRDKGGNCPDFRWTNNIPETYFRVNHWRRDTTEWLTNRSFQIVLYSLEKVTLLITFFSFFQWSELPGPDGASGRHRLAPKVSLHPGLRVCRRNRASRRRRWRIFGKKHFSHNRSRRRDAILKVVRMDLSTPET